MALIKCTECKSEISSNASSCPKCGNPTISNNLFVKDQTEDAHIKKIYTYVRAGKSDVEIADLLNTINVKPIDEEAWTQGLVESIRKNFKLDKKSPVFLSSSPTTKENSGCLIWSIGLTALALLFFNLGSDNSTENHSTPQQSSVVSSSESETIRQLIEINGYKCRKVEAIHPFILSTGYSVYCDEYTYHYEAEDKGGVWIVTVK